MARAPFQLRNTASTAPRSCLIGSCGNGLPVTSLTTALYCVHSSLSVAAGISASLVMPAAALASSSGCSKRAPSTSRTMRPYIEMKRR